MSKHGIEALFNSSLLEQRGNPGARAVELSASNPEPITLRRVAPSALLSIHPVLRMGVLTDELPRTAESCKPVQDFVREIEWTSLPITAPGAIPSA